MYQNIDRQALQHQVTLKLDQTYIRNQRTTTLSRFCRKQRHFTTKSGVSDEPMKGAIQFTSPQAFETTFNLPSGRAVTGMSIPEGIT